MTAPQTFSEFSRYAAVSGNFFPLGTYLMSPGRYFFVAMIHYTSLFS